MKKAFSIILSLVLLCSLAVPAMAANEPVVYTSDSSFVAGNDDLGVIHLAQSLQLILDLIDHTPGLVHGGYTGGLRDNRG